MASKVAYYYDQEVGCYHYGPWHPIKPRRVQMAHSLVVNYGLYKKMDILRPRRATIRDMTKFHSDEYINFLHKVTPELTNEYRKHQDKFNVGEDGDCPVFAGMFEFFSISAGGSIEGAQRLNHGHSDVAINWAGGLHHAKRNEASGFCYVNDIVLAILELLKYHQRVLYIDIDIHHGDGVEEAFYTTDRVMTCSFHKFGEYFPGTGDLRDVGHGRGKYYSINFPLRDGIDDFSYKNIFEPVIQAINDRYRPGVIVLQCGADSLAGDRLGCFNLSMHGHAQCVKFVKSLGVPVMLLGGGGYTIRNVARTWAFETGLACGIELDEEMPYNDYLEYYGPDFVLNVSNNNMDNLNTREYLERTRDIILENLKQIQHAPSVQLQAIPPDGLYEMIDELAASRERNMDERTSRDERDGRVEHAQEYYDNDDDEQRETRAGGSIKPIRDVQNYGSTGRSGKIVADNLNVSMDVDQ